LSPNPTPQKLNPQNQSQSQPLRRSVFGRSLLLMGIGMEGLDLATDDSFIGGGLDSQSSLAVRPSSPSSTLSSSLSSPPLASSASRRRREFSFDERGSNCSVHSIVVIDTHPDFRVVLLRPPLTDRVTALAYFDPNEPFRRIIESWDGSDDDENAEQSTWIEVARDNSSALKQASVVSQSCCDRLDF
jgi:hypothetical protein